LRKSLCFLLTCSKYLAIFVCFVCFVFKNIFIIQLWKKNWKQLIYLPTAVKLKKPCCHLPMYKARSFKQNKPGTHVAIFGLTDNNSPAKCLRISGCHAVGE
jgi:hypothetical protein